MISASWLSHSVSPTSLSAKGLRGRGMLLYHEMDESSAHGMGDVKKLSKQSERAADQAQMDSTSSNV